MQAIGPRGERAIARFARAQRDFRLLMPLEFLVRARPHRLRFGAGTLRRLVLPRPIERLRGAWAEHEEIISIVGAEGARPCELELDDGDDAAADDERHGKGCLVIGRARAAIDDAVFRGRGVFRIDDYWSAASDGIGYRGSSLRG